MQGRCRMSVRLVVLSTVLFTAAFGLACDDGPTAPSPTPTPLQPSAPPAPPPPGPAPDFSALTGLWNAMVRVTEVTGSGCVADTMRSQMAVPTPYSLSISQQDYTLRVTLKSASGDYACTFTPVADSDGFTTFGKPGYYTCEQTSVPVRCADGTMHGVFSFGEDISGRLVGAELRGDWAADWFEGIDQQG